jgi:Abnormal spindle-like microcephaly-assoc'd, ASPM-SPD-2-Hydin
MRKRVIMLVLMGLALTALVLAVPEAMAKSKNQHQGKDTTTPTQHSQNQTNEATTTSTTNQARAQKPITVTPKTLHFGSVPVGSSKQLVVTFNNNTGTNQMFEFSKFKGATAAFTMPTGPPPFTINTPPGPLPIPTTFTPTKKGKQKATYLFTAGNFKQTVTLIGKGT